MKPRDVPEQSHEQLLDELQKTLQYEATMPIGLIARLQAGALRARVTTERFTIGERMVLGSIVFTALAYRGGTAQILVGLLIGTVYAWRSNLLGPADLNARHR